ncbi:hypothetical protein GCM10019059_13830 [Camelimonas fluminis]|uniref:Uncharacterized protein n=1 Tax=Camelimonas fluminis TaxID=1576911 RepID=A0ABV7ULC1_9HYPH|nr:hypothetical protein [Camelimonas fluminis]GHE55610.1 hypothetical protein GCM10019059_13830 [Camelimonas fluminis]
MAGEKHARPVTGGCALGDVALLSVHDKFPDAGAEAGAMVEVVGAGGVNRGGDDEWQDQDEFLQHVAPEKIDMPTGGRRGVTIPA